MAESRCGLLCSECQYREIMKCEGCPIKSCVEGKNLEHCGQCQRFPCKRLHEFAFDPATGSEGTRIENLTSWQEG